MREAEQLFEEPVKPLRSRSRFLFSTLTHPFLACPVEEWGGSFGDTRNPRPWLSRHSLQGQSGLGSLRFPDSAKHISYLCTAENKTNYSLLHHADYHLKCIFLSYSFPPSLFVTCIHSTDIYWTPICKPLGEAKDTQYQINPWSWAAHRGVKITHCYTVLYIYNTNTLCSIYMYHMHIVHIVHIYNLILKYLHSLG